MACAVNGVKLHDAYITVDTMAISRDKLLKDLLPGLNDMFKYGADYHKLVDQIIANEERSARYKKELEDAIQEQSR